MFQFKQDTLINFDNVVAIQKGEDSLFIYTSKNTIRIEPCTQEDWGQLIFEFRAYQTKKLLPSITLTHDKMPADWVPNSTT